MIKKLVFVTAIAFSTTIFSENISKHEEEFQSLTKIYHRYMYYKIVEKSYSESTRKGCQIINNYQKVKGIVKEYEVFIVNHYPLINPDLAWQKAIESIDNFRKFMPDGVNSGPSSSTAVKLCIQHHIEVMDYFKASLKSKKWTYRVKGNDDIIVKDF